MLPEATIPTYALVNWDEDELLTNCTDVEGLFVPPHPPGRARITLLGCTRADALRQAFRPGAGARTGWGVGYAPQMRYLCVANLDRKGTTVRGDAFPDATVVDVVPCARDLARHDVTVEYDDEMPVSWGEAVGAPFSPGYTVGTYGVGDEVLPLGEFRQIAWACTHEPEPVHAMTLVGCDPRGSLAAAIRATSPRRRALGPCNLRVFDDTGREAIEIDVRIDIREVRPSRVGVGLVDIVSLGSGYGLPTHHVRPTWDLWLRNPPGEPGTWVPLDRAQRRAWLTFGGKGRTYENSRLSARGVRGGVCHVDGTHATDPEGFLCAFGEALFGPGGCATGYELRDVVDVPLRIVWHGAEVAREMWDPAEYAYLMDDLARSGVVVDFRRGRGRGRGRGSAG